MQLSWCKVLEGGLPGELELKKKCNITGGWGLCHLVRFDLKFRTRFRSTVFFMFSNQLSAEKRLLCSRGASLVQARKSEHDDHIQGLVVEGYHFMSSVAWKLCMLLESDMRWWCKLSSLQGEVWPRTVEGNKDWECVAAMEMGKAPPRSSRVVWFYACVALILSIYTHKTSAAVTCRTDLATAANITIFPTDALQCMNSKFSPDNSGNVFVVWVCDSLSSHHDLMSSFSLDLDRTSFTSGLDSDFGHTLVIVEHLFKSVLDNALLISPSFLATSVVLHEEDGVLGHQVFPCLYLFDW